MGDRSFFDPCYNRHYKIVRDLDYFAKSDDNPFTAPKSILEQFLARPDVKKLIEVPIHRDLAAVFPLSLANLLVHALGTWHVAERCLEFDRIKFQKGRPDAFLGPQSSTLASRLVFGDRNEDTLLEEFCLAAFFQAYLGLQTENDLRNTEGDSLLLLRGELEGNAAFKAYQQKQEDNIRLDVVAYWIDGQGPPPSISGARPIDGSLKMHQHIERVRSLYFAPDAPLNLRHLDIVARAYYEAHKSDHSDDPEWSLRLILKRFLGRIRLAARFPRGRYLLEDSYWDDRSPYFIPKEDDEPMYRFFEPFVAGLDHVRERGRSEANIAHSIFGTFDPIQAERRRGGFLRLSLSGQPFDQDTARFHRRLAESTGPS